ncbi:MAG: zf-HC2 domain-containing protein [Candidatus Aminicenantales bacterium]
MNCLTFDKLYLYLEKELSPEEIRIVEAHLSSCLKCREALEERRLLLQAAESLPSLEVPPDFDQRVLARIPSRKSYLIGWPAAAAASLSTLFISFLLAALITTKNLPHLLTRLDHILWSYLQNAALFSAKVFKWLSLFVKILQELVSKFLAGLSFLAAFIDWEIYMTIITIVLILLLTMILGMRRRHFIHLENTHEK